LVGGLKAEAQQFASSLVLNSMGMVYGGSTDGLMGLMANSVLEKGGEVTGVFPRGLFPTEIEHQGLTELVYTADLLERKRVMMEGSDAFVVFPGGLGTLDEALEVLTWRSLGKLTKPIVFYNWQGFWDSFLTCMKDLEAKNVLYPEAFESFQVADSIDEVFEGLKDARK